MHTGPIQAQGQLYLRRSVAEVQATDGTLQYLYPLAERYKVGEAWVQNNWLGVWGGEPARQFYRAHWQQLKAGAAINVLLERIRVHNHPTGAELHGHIHSASMAPERWGDKPDARAVPVQPAEEITCSADARQ
jgi:hypothetical protein